MSGQGSRARQDAPWASQRGPKARHVGVSCPVEIARAHDASLFRLGLFLSSLFFFFLCLSLSGQVSLAKYRCYVLILLSCCKVVGE